MSVQTHTLHLTVGMPNGEERIETYDPRSLVHPDDVGKRRPRRGTITVTTSDEAEAWGRALIAGFNRDTDRPRTFVAAALIPLAGDAVLRAQARALFDRAERSSCRAIELDRKAAAARDNARRLLEKGKALLAQAVREGS